MTTQRKRSQATSRLGVNAVRDLVERANCLFQEIELTNDVGNDAYIEFIRAEEATGCCIVAQIKSGPSYVAANGSFTLRADRDHFEYWRSHILPVAGFVVEPNSGRVGWCDITAYLRANPNAVTDGPYSIIVPPTQVLTAQTFGEFQEHFMGYRAQFSDDAHFAQALEHFAALNEPRIRLVGLRSLFSFHRNRTATWVYVASLLRSIEDPDLLWYTVRALSHLPGHGDISWGTANEMTDASRSRGTDLLKVVLGRDEVVKLLGVVDENGFTRGTIGQDVHSIIDLVPAPARTLQSIAFDRSLPAELRQAAVFLFVFYAQDDSVERCIETLHEYRRDAPQPYDEVVAEVIATLEELGHVSFY